MKTKCKKSFGVRKFTAINRDSSKLDNVFREVSAIESNNNLNFFNIISALSLF